MKPFDLEAAKNGAAVVDSRGPVNIIHFNADSENPITALVKMASGGEFPKSYCLNGFRSDCHTTLDIEGSRLFMAPVKKECWINFYGVDDSLFPVVHETEAEADTKGGVGRISCIHHTWEE